MTGPCHARPPAHAALRARRRLLSWLGGGLGGLLAAGCAQPPRRGVRGPASEVVPFSLSPADGRLPLGWEPYRLRRDIPPSHYFTVADDGHTVLRGQTRRGASGLRCPLDADFAQRPWLHWRWRAQALAQGARADLPECDDSPARIVLAFDGEIAALPLRERIFFEQVELFTGQRLPYAMLMYVWDTTLPVGSVVPYAHSERIRRLVVHSGALGLGQWLPYRRHIAADYLRVFGEPPGRLVSVGVFTDADDLRQPMSTDYGDIALQAA